MPFPFFGRRVAAAELLDGALRADANLAGNLSDLARINRWTGADYLRWRALRYLLHDVRASTLTLLDVGGGRGDGLTAATRAMRLQGLTCRGILLDRSAPVLTLAQRQFPAMFHGIRGDGSRLPFGAGSVDVAVCSLVLHHCSLPTAVSLLSEMRRVARLGVVIDDLVRSHVGHLGARLTAGLVTRNAMTRHDGPVSVRRAFTAREIGALLAAATLQPLWRVAIPGYRMVVAARPAPSPP